MVSHQEVDTALEAVVLEVVRTEVDHLEQDIDREEEDTNWGIVLDTDPEGEDSTIRGIGIVRGAGYSPVRQPEAAGMLHIHKAAGLGAGMRQAVPVLAIS